MQSPVRQSTREQRLIEPVRTSVRFAHEEGGSDRKARGGFYTPRSLTRFLAEWAIHSPVDRVLEPSTGDGAFLRAAARRLRDLGATSFQDLLFGVELVDAEAKKAQRLVPEADVRIGSFFELGRDDVPSANVVIGNPPYIRFHGFGGQARAQGQARAAEQGVQLNGLASSWAHFVVHAASFLPASGGRLAMVLPAELMHADYAAPVRAFLLRRFRSVTVVAFDRATFDAQVDAVLLLASDDGAAGLTIVRATDAESLPKFGSVVHAQTAADGRWTIAIDEAGRAAYTSLVGSSRFLRLREMAMVDIGLVTGANAFFVLSEGRARDFGLPREALSPIIERPSDLKGTSVDQASTKYLLDLRGKPHLTADKAISAYLAAGEREGTHLGYKCRTRNPWYGVPVTKAPADLFIPYMSHGSPRLIANAARAYSTNLIHAVRLKVDNVSTLGLSLASLSAATALSAEVEGRAYGGGVLKLETKEAESLLLPNVSADEERRLRQIGGTVDRLVRAGRVDEASRIVDAILGIDHDRLASLTGSLRSRRLGLRGRSRPAA